MKFRSLIKSSLAEQLQHIAENLRTYTQETNEYLHSSTGEGIKNIKKYNDIANYIQEGNVKGITTILHTLDNDTRNVILDMIRTESPMFSNVVELDEGDAYDNDRFLVKGNKAKLDNPKTGEKDGPNHVWAENEKEALKKFKEDDGKITFGPKTGKESYPMGYSDEGRFKLYVVTEMLPRIKDIEMATQLAKALDKIDGRGKHDPLTRADVDLIERVFASAHEQGLLKRYMSARKVPVRNTEESVHVYEDCGCGGDMGCGMAPAPEAAPQFKLFMWNPITGELIPLETANVQDMGPIDDFHTSYSGEY
jgi:hypothetical protein